MSETVLITGGTGFIGRHLCSELLAHGWSVDVLTRDTDRARRVLPENVHVMTDPAASRNPAVVVNLAGENLASGRWSRARKRELGDSRMRVTGQIIDYIANAAQRPRVLVSGSAVGIYGARGGEQIPEDTPPGDEFQSRLVSDWEAAAAGAEDYGVRVCLIRTGLVLGTDGGALASMLRPFRLGLGGPFGSGEQHMPWIHLRDEIRAIRFCIDNPDCRGAYNLTAPEPVTNRDFAETLAATLNRPAWLSVPAPALRLALGEMARLVLTGQRAVPNRLLEAGFEFEYERLGPALEALLREY